MRRVAVRRVEMKMRLGFVGLGAMGEPMALNLLRAGHDLMVWNRSPAKTESLARAGAKVSETIEGLFAACDVILLMLTDGAAIDAVLARTQDDFGQRVKGKTIVHMGTTSAEYSSSLEADVLRAGGCYVEAPVSGSRKPAEKGELVAMLAGRADSMEAVSPLLSSICRQTILCGPVPQALQMKFAVNSLLIGMVTSFAEAMHLAEKQGLDRRTLLEIVLAGPMANDVLRVKGPKLLERDFAPQATITTVLNTNQLIVNAARLAGAQSPLADLCLDLNRRAAARGRSELDMVAVLTAIEEGG